MQFLSIFRETWWLRMLKTFKKEQISCLGGFFGKVKAIGVEKMHQILTEIEKNTKNSNFENFMQFLCNFGKPWWLRISEKFNKEQIDSQKGFFRKKTKFVLKKRITIHMPQRTSKILLVRLTANRNALLFLIRVSSFARYTV